MGSSSSHENANDNQVNRSVGPHPRVQSNRGSAACSDVKFKTGVFRTCPKGPVVGIDLGTTNSCVAVFHEGKVDIIANEHSNRTTPSCVTFTDQDRLVGEAAVRQMGFNPENTVFGAKRLMGLKFDDPQVQSSLMEWPFKVVAGHEDKAKVQVTYKGIETEFYPEEISAMVLYKLRQMAESYLSRPVTQAVFTVPLYFNDAQRQAIIDAAAIAGLKVLELVKEPFAAAMAYHLNETRQCRAHRNIVIFNMGGGTLNISILTYQNEVFEIKGMASFKHFGGEDFNQRLVFHLVEEFKKMHQLDPSQCRKSMQKLKVASENAKRDLSCSVTATIAIEALYKGVDFHTIITRATFEDLCADLFQIILDLLEQMMNKSGISKSKIHDIVLVGGSSRIPFIQNLLSKFFDGHELVKSINPEEVLAHGAATVGAIRTGHRFESKQNLIFLDVTPLSLGLETVGGSMDVVIQRNTPIPTKETRNYTTTEDNQESLCLQVYEGERMLTKHNNLLGKFTLSGIRPMPRGVPIIVVEFEIDHNNILTVSATETGTNMSHQLTITDNRGRLDKEEMQRITKEEEEYRAREKAQKEKTEALNSLETTTRRLKRAAETEAVDERAKRRVLEMCEETVVWLEENKLAPKKEYEKRKRELENVGFSIISHFTTGAKKS